jgi:hypothetical protein
MMLLVTFSAPVSSISSDDVKSELAEAYIGVRNAEKNGANVTLLVTNLNIAARLIDAGGESNITRAYYLINEVKIARYVVESTSIQFNSFKTYFTTISLIIIGVFGILIWFYGTKIYWSLWLRTRGKWRVERI